MPVSNISTDVDSSSKLGGSLWIGWNTLASTGPSSSMGAPTTLRMRPSTAEPTGMAMGWPVLVASCPRVSPSVESMAMQRQAFSPRCWATSMTKLSSSSLMVGFVSLRAV